MLFFIELQLFGSARVWRSSKRDDSFKKGLVDDSNLKTKADYFNGPDILLFLTAAVRDSQGVLIRKGRLTDCYYLVFPNEHTLNSFVGTYGILLSTIPILAINAISNTNCVYRLEDYLFVLNQLKKPVGGDVKVFLETNLSGRYSQFRNLSAFFFTKLHWLLTTAKQ